MDSAWAADFYEEWIAAQSHLAKAHPFRINPTTMRAKIISSGQGCALES